jgi:diaminopimelate epimerase
VDGTAAQADGLVRPHLVGTTIYKMTGSGNDFVMVDARHTPPSDWSSQDIRAVCARGTGIGADGLVFVGPGSAQDAVRMIYFNSDGSRAAMCGNAALCSTRLAARLGLTRASQMTLETDAGTYVSRCDGQQREERAELHLAPVKAPAPVAGLASLPNERRAVIATVGVPHLVVLVDDVDQVDVVARGKALRSDQALGPAGANVNFISAGPPAPPAPPGPQRQRSEWRMRTYERGVEDETLACGTGAVAAACALVEWGMAQPPFTFWTRSGRHLEVLLRKAADVYDDVWLGGEARLVVRGVIN